MYVCNTRMVQMNERELEMEKWQKNYSGSQTIEFT